MPKSAVLPIRICLHCRKAIRRKRYPSGWLESPTNYAKRVYCSNSCHMRHANPYTLKQQREYA